MCRILLDRIGGRITVMTFRAAFALAVSLAVPAWAQHQTGTGHGSGFSGGGAGHGAVQSRGGWYGHPAPRSGYSGRAPSYYGLTGLQAPSSFSAPGLFPTPGRLEPPARAGSPLPFRGNGFYAGNGQGRDHRGRDSHRGSYGGRGHDRDHGRRHRGYGSYGYAPGYVYAYPYVADPGFYDWGATDYSENEQGQYADVPPDQGPGYGPEAPYPGNGEAPYLQQQENAQPGPVTAPVGPQRQEYHFATASPTAPSPIASKPLTVIFKGGRAPEKMQNYMVNSSSLTNLDSEHFEKIPLDQIDVAATQQANRSSGIDFQVPVASHD